MKRRIWINPDRLTRGQKNETFDGIELTVEISPYSVPKTVVGTYLKKEGRFLIEFVYIDNEKPSRKVSEFDGVLIQEGRYSGKLLSISIPIASKLNKDVCYIRLKTKISNAFKERGAPKGSLETGFHPDLLNQEVAEEILNDANLKELTADVPG